MFTIKKQFQVSVVIPTLTTGKYFIGDQPQLRNVKTTAIEAYIATGLGVDYKNNPVVAAYPGITVTLAIQDGEGVSRENFISMPYSSFIRTLNGGIYSKFPGLVINWSKSYITVSSTTGLTAGQAAAFSVYYE